MHLVEDFLTLGRRFPSSWDLLAANAWWSWSLTLKTADLAVPTSVTSSEDFVNDSISWLHDAWVAFYKIKNASSLYLVYTAFIICMLFTVWTNSMFVAVTLVPLGAK